MEVSSRTYTENGEQFVILPDEVAFGEEIDVEIERQGDVITIRPARRLAEKSNVSAA